MSCLAAAVFMSTHTLADPGNGNGGTASVNGNHGSISNPYNPAYGHPYRHGAIPTLEGMARIEQWNADNNPSIQMDSKHAGTQPGAAAGMLSYGGAIQSVGVMSGAKSKVYLIFYGNQWGTQTTDSNGNMVFSNDSAGAAQAAQNMFKGIGTNNETWSAELTQWCDGSTVSSGATSCPSNTPAANFIPYQQGGVLAGVWYDNSVASPAQASGNQLGAEALAAAHHFGNTTAASNRQAYYVILSPTGVNPDDYKNPTTGYCAWHDYNGDTTLTGGAVTSDVGPFAFSNQPYNIDQGANCGVGFVNSPGTLDGYTMTLGHEWHETLSDQFPAGGWTNHTGGTYNGQENSDECAWISPGSAGGAANISFGSFGAFAEQASWSNDTGACAISHPIVNHGGSTAGTPTANFSFSTSGLTANFTDSSTDAGGTIGSHSWTFGDGASSTATNPSHTYASGGTYSVTETVADSVDSTKTSSKTSSVTVTAPAGSVLQNGVAISISDSVTNHQQNWTMDVPAGATNLKFAISGGTGDADLYVKFGSAPTLSSYDCRPYLTGNNESCPIATAQAGTYYVMVNTYAPYSTTLVGSYTAPGGGGTPTANFTFTTSGLSATFTDSSTDSGGTIGTYAWNFGDGTSSSTKSPSHTYAAGGTYNVTETVTDSTSGKTSSKTSAVSVSGGGGGGSTQLFANTSFEGTLSPWSGTSGVDCSAGCSGESAHTGTGFVWLDGYGTTHTDTLSQTVTVPAGKTSGTVSFYLHVDTAETTTTTAYDTLTVKLGSTTIATFSNLNAASGYQLHSYNVNVTAGQNLTLTFTGTEDSSNQTSFVIDDVTFTVQ